MQAIYRDRLLSWQKIGELINIWDVLEPEGDVIGIGSGGNYALAAAKVLMDTDLSAEEVAKKAIKVASDICVFTNNNLNIEKV